MAIYYREKQDYLFLKEVILAKRWVLFSDINMAYQPKCACLRLRDNCTQHISLRGQKISAAMIIATGMLSDRLLHQFLLSSHRSGHRSK
jgi:hypothetical protein